ncbi:MAG: ribosome maturation factor [Treponema sp.]|nr:ribosome maturation factor [Treponema sp.]
MNYTSPDSIPHFKECAALVDSAGFTLVELQVVPQKGSVHVTAVIASKDVKKDIGVADCSKVHHALQPELISMLGVDEDNFYMEVCSPGMERNFKNAAEFAFFVGREIRVWDKTVGDWVGGVIKSSDEKQVTLLPLENQEEGSDKSGGEKTVAYENIAKAKFIHL